MERTRRGDWLDYRRSKFSDMAALGGLRYDPIWDGKPDAYNQSLQRYARTFTVNGKPAALLGMAPKWEGVAMAWSYIEPSYFEHNFANTRALIVLCKHLIEWYQQGTELRRMEVLVDADDVQAMEFSRTLGFVEETGRMKHAGPLGEDLIVLVRFWET